MAAASSHLPGRAPLWWPMLVPFNNTIWWHSSFYHSAAGVRLLHHHDLPSGCHPGGPCWFLLITPFDYILQFSILLPMNGCCILATFLAGATLVAHVGTFNNTIWLNFSVKHSAASVRLQHPHHLPGGRHPCCPCWSLLITHFDYIFCFELCCWCTAAASTRPSWREPPVWPMLVPFENTFWRHSFV